MVVIVPLCVQNVIDNEAFLEGGDRDHTTSLLGDDFATELCAKESFDAEKQQLQVKLFCFLNATVQEYPAHHMQFILCESLPLPPELTCSV